jgi:hypothetical protein
MRGERVTTQQILGVIADLERERGPKRVRGSHVRAVLRDRFGTVANTDRVYRLLHAQREAPTPVPAPSPPLSDDERLQYEAALRRADLVERREQAQTEYLATQVDRLRQELKQLRDGREHARLIDAQLDLHRRLRAREDTIAELEVRVAQLEQLLIAHDIAIPTAPTIERPRFG